MHVCRCTHKLYINALRMFIQFVSALVPFTHAWTPEKNRLILIILKFNIVDKNVLFLHIPGLKIAQIKILRNVVDDFGTLTTIIIECCNIYSSSRKQTTQSNELLPLHNVHYEKKYGLIGTSNTENIRLPEK